MLRLTTVAVLLGAAATVTWAGPATCTRPSNPPDSRRHEATATPAPDTTSSPTGAGTASKPTQPDMTVPPAQAGTTPSPAQLGKSHTGAGATSNLTHTDTADEMQPGTLESARTAEAPLPPPAGTVGVPIRLAEPSALRLVRSGDRVDVFRAGESTRPIAGAALVLAVTGLEDPLTGGLLLALPPEAAKRTVKPAPGGYVVVIRPDG